VPGRLSFGVIVLPSLSWAAIAERWTRLERLGLDSAWLPDHFVNPRGPIDHWFEAWTLLAALAAQVPRLRIGTLVTTMTLRSPALLARQALTVDHVSGGRLTLGVGAGGAMMDHTMTGIEPWPRAERRERFGEYVAVLDRVLRQERTSYAGRYFRLVDTSMVPAPIQTPRVPIMIGGNSRPLLRITAALGDVWNTNGTRDSTPEEAHRRTRTRGDALDAYCAEAGRPAGAVMRSFMMGQTQDACLASRDAFVDFVGRYRGLGFSEFILFWLRDPNPDYPLYAWITDPAMLERVATDWIPAARAAVGGAAPAPPQG
jgi:alkanesulfonate monooxygenase SsuD/methylene tetrahydromethanopterin reductase-like flavin-dependent oxidoreductase (luciferase family)